MKMAGEQRIAASRQRVWNALNDPEVLRASIPGCQTLEKEAEDRFTATIEVKIGPIGARFKGAVQLADLDPPNGYTIIGEGNAGIVGSAKGAAKVRLTEDGGGALISYTVEAEVSGRLAQLGGPIIDATAKQLAAKFFSSFGQIVSGEKPAVGPAPAAARRAASGAAAGPGAAPSLGSPLRWILALAAAALAGFLFGRGLGETSSNWAGVAIGLLIVVVAGGAFEYGRRTAAPVLMLDPALLKRLIEGVRE